MRAMIGALAGGAFVDKGGEVVVQLALAASAPSNHNSHENDDGDDDGDDDDDDDTVALSVILQLALTHPPTMVLKGGG